jgi:UDP-N-acetylmuramoyl-tripeptide--D-alanyl-D-alanine ligase
MSNLSEGAEVLFEPPVLVAACGGRAALLGRRPVRAVVTDSREAGPDCLFVALPGARVDGHSFIGEALQRGASAVVASEGFWRGAEAQLRPLLEGRQATLVCVPDTLTTLQRLSAHHLRRFPSVLRIGVTGSNGKTTTKEIIGSILGLEAPTVISEGNLNSEIGLPLSCFRVRQQHRFAVFEMGVNRPGEMEVLADIYRPDFALITNIGSAHIGPLGSRRGIAREKRKIFRHFDGRQTAFLDEGEPFFGFLTRGLKGRVVRFGPQSTRGYQGSEDLGLDGSLIHWEGLQIRFPIFGRHNVSNALAAISISAELGLSSSRIGEGLQGVRPLSGRSQILRGAVTVIQDCYNANPDSVEEVVRFLGGLRWAGRKIGVFGSMKELGSQSAAAHRALGRVAAGSDLQALFLFGPETAAAAEAARASGYTGSLFWTEDFQRLREGIRALLRPGDLVLLKGSRAVELERLLPDLQYLEGKASAG